MKSSITNDKLPDECFVVQIDGRVKSVHRRFVDALREGLLLRDEFPQHEVKVRASEIDSEHHTTVAKEGALN